ncbi:hypothetical protein Bca52824_008224 [Brassica carinata]|uniref:Uncharacterized protein n=1 Tax=Brassica carinata TaxID=52824 RepID=A0A8X7W9F1_BRACI|nr:hypothetical protein Bca52824_008224 [Brassica carinata]
MRSVSGGWFISYTRVACGSFCYSLKTTHTITWEEYKNKQKEEDMKNGELEADTDKLMHEYRAQLDAERALKLSQGRNYSSDKTSKTFFVRILVLTHYSSSESSSSSDEDESRRSSSKRSRKHKSSRDKHSSKSKDETDGHVPLSRFFGNLKS